LVKSFTAADGPLVRRTARSVEIIYRLEATIAPRLDDLSISYSSELYAHGLIASDCNSTLVLRAGTPDIPVSIDSEWLGARSPLTVARATLPEFDADAASIALADLVERFAAAGDLKVCGRYLDPPTASTDPQYGEIAIGTDPGSWDPADPRRKTPGFAARVRKLREDLMGGTPSRRIDDDALQEKLELRRAACSPGTYAPWLD
jgi:hypothetical protein